MYFLFLFNEWQVVPSEWLAKENDAIYVWWPSEGNVNHLAEQKARVGKRWKHFPVTCTATSTSKSYT